MKHYFILALLLAGTISLYAQDPPDPEAVTISAGGTFGKPKIVPKMDKLAIAQVTVNFKQATTKSVTKNEKKASFFGKQNVASATVQLTAYLETTDGELTENDYQEVTDHFYHYLQAKLKENGVDTVAFSAIAATDFYKEGKEKEDDDKAAEEEKKNGQTWVSYNAQKGNTLYTSGHFFAFGKINRANKFAKDLGAPVVYVTTIVDFVDIMADVNMKTSSNRSYYNPKDITVFKSQTKAAALMKIPAASGLTLFANEKGGAEVMNVVKDIPAQVSWESTITQDPTRAEKRSKLFSVSFSKKMESTPVVIATTRDLYKMAAKKALESYADTFIAKYKSMKKD